MSKTTGNPFFAIQFLSALFEEGLLTFDHVEGRWSWDLNRIHAKGYTDNVVDLMVRKLTRLVPETQNALQQLACLGNSAEFTMLRVGLPRLNGSECMPNLRKRSRRVLSCAQTIRITSFTIAFRKPPIP